MSDAARSKRLQRLLATALFCVAFGTQAPSPVLLYYTAELGLSSTQLTLFFTAYAVGLLPSLLLGGPVSDRRGRKVVVVPFIALCALALAALTLGSVWGEPALFIGRFLQGLTSGAVFTVGTVWIREMAGERGAARAAMFASAAMAMGFALGPLISGTLVQWAPAPGVLAFVVPLLLMAVALAIAIRLPETMTERRSGKLQIGVPAQSRRGFYLYLLPVGLLVYTFAVLSLTIFPLQIAKSGFVEVFFLTGVCALLVQGSAAASTGVARRLGPASSGWIAGGLATIGLVMGYFAVQPGLWPWVLPASIFIGVAEGLGMTSGVTVADLLAPADRRGGLMSVFYIVVYFGFTVPTIVSLVAGKSLDSGIPILVLAGASFVIMLILLGPGRRVLGVPAASSEQNADAEDAPVPPLGQPGA